jgi:hypothetical protein
MGSLISISSPQNQLKQNRSLLLFMGGVSTVAGVFMWSATPFALSDRSDRVQVCLRYLALTSSLVCGVSACVAGQHLQRITPLLKAVETAEQNDFLTQLASSQYVQQQQWHQVASSELQAFQPGNRAVTSVTQPDLVKQPSDERFNSVTESGNGNGNASNQPSMEGYKPLFLAVTQLKQAGVSDSKIIKDVLKQEGRNFETGKQMLETLLELGLQQEW